MFVPNFEILGAVAPENLQHKFPYTGMRDAKKEKGKKIHVVTFRS